MKTNKDKIFKLKNSFKNLLLNTCKCGKNCSLKTCLKQLKRRHIYSHQKFCPLAVWKGQKCPSGRLPGRPANSHFYDRCASGRPAPTREWGAFSRSTTRSIGRLAGLCARPVHIGRPCRSTGFWSGRLPEQSCWVLGFKNLSF